jgi:tetratricopeptide (TPR) repeat protein
LNPELVGSYMGLASVARARQRYDAAEKHLDQALELAPLSVGVWVARGDLWEVRGQEDKAREDYREALRINPDFVPALNNLAYLLIRAGGDKNLNEALPLVQRAKRLAPGDARVTDTMGWVLAQRGAYTSALEELTDAVEQMPGNPVFQYHLGYAYLKSGDKAKARAHLLKALESSQDFEGRAEAQRLLRQSGG